MRSVISIFVGIVVITGCASRQPMIFEGTNQVYDHCVRQFQKGYIRSKTDHVNCINQGFEHLVIINNYPHRDLFDIQASYRLALANQVDNELIDIAEAEDRMADLSEMIAEEEYRRASSGLKNETEISKLISEINEMSATAAGPVICTNRQDRVACRSR